MNITYEFLKQEPTACIYQRRKFAQVFRKSLYPDGVEPTFENYQRADNHGLALSWLFREKFPDLYAKKTDREEEIFDRYRQQIWTACTDEERDGLFTMRQIELNDSLQEILDAIKALPQPTIE